MSERFQRYRFEELEVWNIGMKIVHECYVIAKKFPRNEVYALADQLQRAATSVVLNIAEGSGQSTKKSFSLYLQRAKSSVLECVACVKIALQENFISSNDSKSVDLLFREEYFKIIALNKSLHL